MSKAKPSALALCGKTLEPGDPVVWLHEERGGYGYVSRVLGRVVRPGAVRATIRVFRLGDAAWATRTVALDKLWPMNEADMKKLDELEAEHGCAR